MFQCPTTINMFPVLMIRTLRKPCNNGQNYHVKRAGQAIHKAINCWRDSWPGPTVKKQA